MATPSRLEAAISRIIAISSTVSEAELEQAMAVCVSESLEVESVSIKGDVSQGSSNLFDYVLNTKRPYVDNELSEYSSFPELTVYWSRGQKSCAFIPIMLSGRVVSIIEMMSKQENRFTEELMKEAATLSYLIGLSISYRKEESKSMRLASYFNAAFDSPVPQILVANDGSIIRFNRAAASEFGSPGRYGPSGWRVSSASRSSRRRERTKGGRALVSRKGDRNYAISLAEAGTNLSYVTVRNVTESDTLAWVTSLMNQSYGAGIMLLDGKLQVSYATQSIRRIIGYDSTLTISRSIVELVAERDRGAFKEILEAAGKAAQPLGRSAW